MNRKTHRCKTRILAVAVAAAMSAALLSQPVSAFAASDLLTPTAASPTESEFADHISELRAVKDVDDSIRDPFKLLIMGDGFDKTEQEKFFEKSTEFAQYFLQFAPYSEFEDLFEVDALGVISDESGITNDVDTSDLVGTEEAKVDSFFGSQFWNGNTERAIYIGSGPGYSRIDQLKKDYASDADCVMILANSERYGGTGGDIVFVTMNEQAPEVVLHELGHTIGNLADEYWTWGSENPNKTHIDNIEHPRWERFIGKNGVGTYPYTDGGQDGMQYVKSSINCKMQYLGQQYEFCEVCKEALRNSIMDRTDQSKLFFQPYADEFLQGNGPVDMSDNFILRNGVDDTHINAPEGLKLTYFDEDGNQLAEAPSTYGNYTVKGECNGLTAEGKYTIEWPLLSGLAVADKTYDGSPVEVTESTVADPGIPYTLDYHYTSDNSLACFKGSYDSDAAPSQPGRYFLTATLTNKETGAVMDTETVNFEISYAQDKIVDNSDARTQYNERLFLILGDGYTADQQDEFQQKAKEFTDSIKKDSVLGEFASLINFTTISSLSDSSTLDGTTFLNSTVAEDGSIDTPMESVKFAGDIGYIKVTTAYDGVIILVNDEKATVGVKPRTTRVGISIGATETGYQLGAQELANFIGKQGIGTQWRGDGEAEKTTRNNLIHYMRYDYWGRYGLLLSQAYKNNYYEGDVADVASTFGLYYDETGEPVEGAAFEVTYYDSKNNKLTEAPSAAGDYTAVATFKLQDMGDGISYHSAIGKVNFTIQAVVSKNTLNYFIAMADQLVADGAVDKLVPSAKAAFEKALVKAKEVSANKAATEEEVFDAAKELVLCIQSSDFVIADKEDLQFVTTLSDEIAANLEKYVTAGQEEFKTALAAAKALLDDPNAIEQADVDNAWRKLTDAISKLRLKANKENLQALVDTVSTINLSGYTKESAAAFRSALAAAQEVLANTELSEDDQPIVDNTVKTLEKAKAGLTLNTSSGDVPGSSATPANPQKDTPTTPNKTAPAAKTGDTVLMLGATALLLTACGTIVLARKRKK